MSGGGRSTTTGICLSWTTILRKREGYRRAFDGFEAGVIARYGQPKVAALLGDGGIVRNRAKIAAAIGNARAMLEAQREFGSFDAYSWRFVGGVPRVNGWAALGELPAKTVESEAMSKDLLKRGFKFVGPTICYAFMQAAGLVDDHTIACFRRR